MSYKFLALNAFLVMLFVLNTGLRLEAQSKKEIAEKFAKLEKEQAQLKAQNQSLLDSLAAIDSKLKDNEATMQMLNEKIGHLAGLVENLTEELRKQQAEVSKAQAQPPKPPREMTSIEFEALEFDFGELVDGKTASFVYKFSNSGSKPLKIESAKGSCGCTAPNWPKKPIAPGESGEITVLFNSRGKRGPQNKTITITANTEPAQTILRVKGTVLEAE